MTMRYFGAVILLTIGLALPVSDVDAQVKTRLRFPAGASSTAVRGTIKGFAYRDYIVRANADQNLNVVVDSRTTQTVFSIFRPGGENLEGAVQTADFSGALPVTGDYVIRVGMMRAAARRPRSVSNFTLKISID